MPSQNIPRKILKVGEKAPFNETAEYIIAARSPFDSNAAGHCDLLTIHNFWHEKDRLKKSDQRGIGIELLIADARMLGGKALGDWFTQISEVYRFCVARGDQFVLSSGATAASELVSGSCMDAILARCGINPKRHWAQVADWLDETLSKRILGIAP